MSSTKSFSPIVALFVIPIVGFILLNISFLFSAVIRYSFYVLFDALNFSPKQWMPIFFHLLTAFLLLLTSFLVLRSKRFGDLAKATFCVVPTAVALVYVGIFLSNWPIPLYILSAIIVGIIIFYLYKNNKPWIYYYSVGLVSLALLIMMILGIDI